MVVLALACEEPMHPYRMQTLIKQRGMDRVANVAQRNSVYQTIDALQRAGLIAVRETSRQENRPERTIYGATEDGRQALRSWVRAGLATPAREFPEFPAVLSVLYGVANAADLRALLETRVAVLEPRLAEMEKPVPRIPRLFLLEGEYMAAVMRAEIEWLRGVIADLRSGRLAFPTIEQLIRLRTHPGAPSEEAFRRIAEMRAAAGAEIPHETAGSAPSLEPEPATRRRRRAARGDSGSRGGNRSRRTR
jgi:DNA-binding PadR family transcriptional regulator